MDDDAVRLLKKRLLLEEEAHLFWKRLVFFLSAAERVEIVDEENDPDPSPPRRVHREELQKRMLNDRKLDDEEKDFVFAELFSYPNSLCSENAYEFVFPLDASVYSITVQNNLGWGYKPLKLDPSILPLESPGYKKLREYEESLANRK